MIKRPVVYAGIATLLGAVVLGVFSRPAVVPDHAPLSEYQNAVRLGGEWFLNDQNENFLHYEYSVSEKKYSEKMHELREMGALWSIVRLYGYTKDERYLELAQRGLRYFANNLKKDQSGKTLFYASRSGVSKLGYSAFLILALADIDYPDREKLLAELAGGILNQQEADGSFRTMFDAGGDAGEDYYPGEAMTSLMRLHEITGEERYASAVERALPYYRDYWKGNPNTAFVPWQVRAYRMLYLQKPEPEIRDYVFSLADYMVARELREDGCRNFRFVDDSTVAVWMEGMAAAYDVARRSDDRPRQECYGNYVRDAAAYLMEKQVTAGNDQSAVGGILGSDGKMRVDRNQHFVMGLMDALEFGIIK